MVNPIIQKLIFEFEAHHAVFQTEGSIKINTTEWHELFNEYPIGFGHNPYVLHYHELLHLATYNIGFVKWDLKFDKEMFDDKEHITAVWLEYKYRAECQE